VRVSFLEIYNEELTDLLGAESVENPRLKIYEDNLRKVLGILAACGVYDTHTYTRHVLPFSHKPRLQPVTSLFCSLSV